MLKIIHFFKIKKKKTAKLKDNTPQQLNKKIDMNITAFLLLFLFAAIQQQP